MNKVKTLIVDDSAVYRKLISAALSEIEAIQIVGTAPNGRIAIDQMAESMPDLLILDLQMPVMDGIATLKEMRTRGWNCPTLIFSSLSKEGAAITFEALSLGAIDFATKPDRECGDDQKSSIERVRAVLLPKIEHIFLEFSVPDTLACSKKDCSYQTQPQRGNIPLTFSPAVVVIGSSTGGPSVLESIFKGLIGPLSCPVVIVQHMPPVFTQSFAERLTKISGLPVTEAVDQEALQSGHVYIAPGNYHLRLAKKLDKVTIALDQTPLIHSVRPAVDPLFQTAARIYGNQCLSIVLTGMGHDGAEGAVAVKRKGGIVFIQSKESSVVFGMPGAVFELGAYDRIVIPEEITSFLNEKIGGADYKRVSG